MTINPAGPAGGRTPPAQGAPREQNTRDPRLEADGVVRGDRVEISSEARALAAEGDVDRVPFTETRLQELRELVASGHYDRPEVVAELARRLADSGDLG